MPLVTKRTLRYARAWITGSSKAVEDELVLDRDGVSIPATLVRPAGTRGPVPAWVAMHGITRPGRAHAQLVRFTHALASAGMATIVPEVPEWRELHLSPELTVPSIAAAIRGLRASGVAHDEAVGIVGFSFGAPHAIAAVAHPDIADDIAGVCGFGGYCSIETTFRFMMTGEHEWAGNSHYIRPDPYGRWIAAANYLTSVPEYADAGDVAHALQRLATEAGEIGATSWDATYDPLIAELRAGIDADRRPLFDLFAPASDPTGSSDRDVDARTTDAGWAHEIAEGLAAAARRIDPAIDPTEALGHVSGVAHVLHGHSDHLIPFTESRRLESALRGADVRLTVTRLFGHSSQESFPLLRAASEIPKFSRALSGVLSVV